MADDITLRIDGVDWTYWTSVQVTRQMDAIAGTFSLALADKWIGGAQALPIAAGMACQILIGGEQVIDGYIDQVRPSFSATAHGISVTGRDRSADLVDCAAIHSPGQWLNCTVLQLAQALASPFGVNVTAEGDVGAPIASFKLEEGETAFEALDRALRQRELMACPDGKGGMVLLKAGAGTACGRGRTSFRLRGSSTWPTVFPTTSSRARSPARTRAGARMPAPCAASTATRPCSVTGPC